MRSKTIKIGISAGKEEKMKERTYRFLPEYSNEKKERIKRLSAGYLDNEYIKEASQIALDEINKIMISAKNGYITLDEAMRDIAEVDPMEYVHYLRTLQYDKLPNTWRGF